MTLFDFWNEWEVLHRRHVVNHDVKIISRSDSIQEESHQGSSFKCVLTLTPRRIY